MAQRIYLGSHFNTPSHVVRSKQTPWNTSQQFQTGAMLGASAPGGFGHVWTSGSGLSWANTHWLAGSPITHPSANQSLPPVPCTTSCRALPTPAIEALIHGPSTTTIASIAHRSHWIHRARARARRFPGRSDDPDRSGAQKSHAGAVFFNRLKRGFAEYLGESSFFWYQV